MKIKSYYSAAAICFVLVLALQACTNKNNNTASTPTEGKLNVWYDEALEFHIQNQSRTFESQYPNVQINLHPSSESDAVQALYSDACEAIVISRLLNTEEKKAFESKTYFPKYSAVAKSGVALITNTATAINNISYTDVVNLLSTSSGLNDSLGQELSVKVLLDKNNSSVVHYLKDSILKGKPFSENCNILNSSIEAINYVAQHKNTIAFIDFAWLSDSDDSLVKANTNKVKLLRANVLGTNVYEYPSQSSFKTGTYPFTRSIYVYRKTGDFTLAKGFEAFIAGPKGQIIFLKQGLLPTRQAERSVHINIESIKEE